MNPLRLELRRVRTFEHLDLDLPEQMTALIGPNGSGKSSIVNAIEVALFGPLSRTLADWYPRGGGEEPLQISLIFEHGGATYRVRRSYSPKGRGTSKVDLEQETEEFAVVAGFGDREDDETPILIWKPLTLESQVATQEHLESLIGITRDTFRASSFLAQGEAGFFCEAAPRSRKAILADVLGLHDWDRWLERARTEKRTAESELDRIAGAVGRVEGELAERSLIEEERAEAQKQRQTQEAALRETLAALTTAREALAEAERQAERRAAAEKAVQDAESAVAQAKSLLSQRETEVRTIDVRLAEREGLQAIGDRLPYLAAEKEALVVALQQWKERQRVERELASTVASVEAGETAAADLNAKALKVLEGIGDEKCDRCGQTLYEEAARRASDSFMADADAQRQLAHRLTEETQALSATLAEMPTEQPDESRLPILERTISDAQGANARLAALAEAEARRATALEEIDEMRAGLLALEQASGAARADAAGFGPHDPYELTRLRKMMATLEAEEGVERSILAQLERAIVQADTQLARLDKIAAEVKTAAIRRDALLTEVDLLSSMERACGPNGVPALILESVAIPQIETEATRILGLLGGPAYACELHTLREKKTGGLSDTLDIVLLTETGSAPYESFSGGERARIAFALRLALAQLLASRKGSSTGLLVIDELEGLDQQGIAALVTVLEGLQRSIPRIVVVSHNAEMRDAFENTILLEQVDGRSRLVSEVAA